MPTNILFDSCNATRSLFANWPNRCVFDLIVDRAELLRAEPAAATKRRLHNFNGWSMRFHRVGVSRCATRDPTTLNPFWKRRYRFLAVEPVEKKGVITESVHGCSFYREIFISQIFYRNKKSDIGFHSIRTTAIVAFTSLLILSPSANWFHFFMLSLGVW